MSHDAETSAVAEFLAVLDRLRQDRRQRGDDPALDQPFLDQLDAIYDRLNDDEYEAVNSEGWRGWPDLYDARLAATVEFRLVEALVDPYEADPAEQPPRREAA